jgi:erythromycin esterase-like protein
LELAGVDSNEASLGLNFRGYNILLKDKALARRFVKVDSLMLYDYTTPKSNYYHKDVPFDRGKMESLILALRSEYKSIINGVNELETIDMLQKRVITKGVESKLRELSTSLNKKDDNYFVAGPTRDKIMAKNLEYLLDSLYPNKKIILWAHNAHIRKIPNYPSNQASIVDNLPQRIKDQSFIIGLYALNGECAWGMNAPVPIVIRKTSFEGSYSGFASKALFVPSKNMDKKKREEGFPSNKAIVSELYDGVFIIKDVKASRLIRYNKEYRCE